LADRAETICGVVSGAAKAPWESEEAEAEIQPVEVAAKASRGWEEADQRDSKEEEDRHLEVAEVV
jgi:hypothetical protein